ncbi:MAG: single-stranded-DNA-specific exonuclease RecJ, partial [Deltaproteobacteria bacterium]|nr:single-stranded-DNA-specific exonuclease RecJ [Deltaproteobacteria bacterium]
MWPVEVDLAPQDRVAAATLGRSLGVPAAVAQVLIGRGLGESSQASRFLHPKLADLTPPEAMIDRTAAAERLARACRSHERVTVFGDYDVDGTTSATLLSDVLAALGAEVTTLVADRFSGGYGLSEDALARVLETRPGLVVTCDCGSADHERLASLGRAGIDAIVVDHHLVPSRALPALAFLNPNRPDCGFAFKFACSAGLALSLSAAVRRELGATIDLRPWLDLVGLATVADVMPLEGDNRALVRAGLLALASPTARPGIVALRDIAGVRPGSLVCATDIAFRLAPRLNAPGRIGTAARTVALLRTRSMTQARELAAAVESDNAARKSIERAMTETAIAQVAEVYGERPRTGVVVAAEGWHRGVVGIVAARVVDRFGVPALAVAIDGETGHGSGRTPKGYKLYDAVAKCRGELIGFGGHQAALGLTVQRARIEALRAAFCDATTDVAAERARRVPTRAEVTVDGRIVRPPTARGVFLLEPLGLGNTEPLVVLEGAKIERTSVVGTGHLKLALRVGPYEVHAFGWSMASLAMPDPGKPVDVVGYLRPDGWRGGDTVELR